jgi:hypothetical protein
MTSFLYNIANIIVIASPLKWYLSGSIRFHYYEILIIVFVVIFSIHKYNLKKKHIKLPLELNRFIYFNIGWVAIAAISGFPVLLYSLSPNAVPFFFKGFIQQLTYSIYFIVLVNFLYGLSHHRMRKILNTFFMIVVVSSIYSFLQIYLIKYHSIDIDENVAKYLGMKLRSGEYLNFKGLAYGYLFRVNGLTSDPSSQGALIITAIPYFLYCWLTKRELIKLLLFFILLISLVLTMSGSASVGLFSALIFLFLIPKNKHFNLRVSDIIAFVSFVVIVYLMYSLFENDINYYAQIRYDPNGSVGEHIQIAYNSLKIASKYPFGVGFNNFSIVYEVEYGISGYNPHNVWLSWLVSTGVIGLVYQLMFKLYLIISVLKHKTTISIAFVASVVGVSVAGLGYEVLDSFMINLFFTIFYTVIIADRYRNRIN